MLSTHAPPLSHDALPPYDDHMKGVGRRKQFVTMFRKIKKNVQTGVLSHEKSPKTTHKGVDHPPPTYNDCMTNVEKIIQEATTNPEFQEKIKETPLKTAGSQGNLKAIHESVDQFTANITKINTAFDDIRAKLYAVDRRGLKDSNGEIWKGEPRWVELRDKWRSLLKESQDTARKSVTRCDEFMLFCEGIRGITSMDDQLYKDTIKELEKFTKKADPAGKSFNPEDVGNQATAHSQAFWDLKDKLTDFKTDFDDFAKFQGNQVDPVIKDLNKKIQVIERKIAFDVGVIMSLGVALKITGFATLAGGVITAILGPLSIGAIIPLIIGAIVAVGEHGLAYFTNHKSEQGEKHDELQGELWDNKALKESLEAVMFQLEDPDDGLGFILSQIDLLKNVWHTISNEAHLIAGRLTAATDKETLTYLQADIEAAKGSYKELRDVLAKYGGAI